MRSTPTSISQRAARRLGPKSRIALRWLLAVVLTEAALRVAFSIYAHRHHPNCGLRPELLARLLYAYSHDRVRPDAPEQDGMVPDPRRGYRHAAGLRDRELHGAVMSTNSRGLRGARELEVPKPASVVRVVAIGDSFTFGEGVPDDATWPAQLERALPGIEVANLGERAYAHDQMYFALEDEGLRLEPDAVILGFYPHDAWRDELTFYCFEKPRFSKGPDGWNVENVPVPPPWAVYDRYHAIPLLYTLPRALLEMSDVPPQTDHTGEERAAEILRRTRARAVQAGARFVLVNLPDRPGDAGEPHDFFDAICKESGAECVDSSPLFRATAGTDDAAVMRARFQRPNDVHYSKDGYAVVAEALRRHFTEHPFVRSGPR